jgi:hypothetical protein
MRAHTSLLGNALLVGGLVLAGCGGNTTVDTNPTTTTTTTTGHGGSAGSGGQGTGGAGAQGGHAAGAGGAGQCNASNCDLAFFLCCGDACVNPNNDIHNCQTCGQPCSGPHPYCDQGTCGTAPCGGVACVGPQFCCADACCQPNQLCCDVPASVDMGPQCTDPTPEGTCPLGCPGCVCASPDTPILTPDGERPIAELRAGDLVYSLEGASVVVVPVLRTRREAVAHHEVVRLRLASGAVLEVSGAHPTADGRTFVELRAGDDLDGVAITERSVIPYRHAYTYDILPASATGSYFAGGVRIGSTLAPPR